MKFEIGTMSRHNRPSSQHNRFVASVLLAIALLVIHLPFSHAGWIDEDTPEEARTTTPGEIVPNLPPPKHRRGDDDDDDKKKRKRRREPTQSPTDWPTYYPTSVPSSSPTSVTPEPTQPERVYDLVFSDEFNAPHRTFEDGKDPRWTALEKNDYTNNAQHYYTEKNAYTDTEGNLVIKTEAADTEVVGFNDVKRKKEKIKKHFKSAMLQSWNKFCFTGGVMEAEMALPGKHNIGGLWPAFWLLGNFARHTYVGSSEHIWPWSSSACSDKSRTAQLISACNRVEHYGLHKGVGRGAPEIDVFEVQPGNIKAGKGEFREMPVGQPFLSSSYQVAPGRVPRPGAGWWPAPGQWYSNLTGGMNTSLNIAFYGSYNHFLDDTDPASQDYWSDAISYNRQLNESHFGKMHRYRVEWDLPDKKGNKENNYTETFGYIRWFLDDEFILEIKGEGLKAAGTGGEISSEPMYMLLNTAISSQWGFPKCPAACPCSAYDCHGGFQETCGFAGGFCDTLNPGAEYKINWVRVYQDKNDPKQKVGCSTTERPTKTFIEAHEEKYMRAGDVHPLKPIRKGGGTCSLTPPTDEIYPESCGGSSHGVCSLKNKLPLCECHEKWTGPHCMNPEGYDDIIWEHRETLGDLGFWGPSFGQGMGIGLVVCVLLGILLAAPVVLKMGRRRMEGYRSVEYEPEV
mmetsp:Transcript_18812/g.33884  ORF Transcript_18812/g.33884 Transcript_18812/m.33884 type:complete len:682 (-) Transcript_18812:178-2223(-)